jgi:hypothetical protein
MITVFQISVSEGVLTACGIRQYSVLRQGNQVYLRRGRNKAAFILGNEFLVSVAVTKEEYIKRLTGETDVIW